MILPLFVLLFCLTFWGLDWSLLYKEFSAVLLLCLLQSWFILIFFSEFLVLFCFSFGFIIVFPLSCLFVCFFFESWFILVFPMSFFLIFDLIPNFGALWRIRVLNTSQHSCILDIIRSQLMNLANAECRRAPLPQAWSKTNSWSENFSPMQISQSPVLKWCWWEDKGNLHISGDKSLHISGKAPKICKLRMLYTLLFTRIHVIHMSHVFTCRTSTQGTLLDAWASPQLVDGFDGCL